MGGFGTLGGLGAPGAPGTGGTPARPMAAAGTFKSGLPHDVHASLPGGFVAPHDAHTDSPPSSTLGGLKHMRPPFLVAHHYPPKTPWRHVRSMQAKGLQHIVPDGPLRKVGVVQDG